MYKNNKILSAAAAVAILASGAIAFDMTKDGGIYTVAEGFQGSITAADIKDVNAMNTSHDENGLDENGVRSKLASKVTAATYIGGVEANANLALSTTGKGDALIYPAFQAKNGWGTEIIVRNTKDRAIVSKVVIYDENDSNEVLDFNVYLSKHDAFRFNIAPNGEVTTRDGSYAAFTDPTYETDGVKFVPHEADDYTGFDDAHPDRKDNFLIGTLPEKSRAGYVNIYGMAQSEHYGYHDDDNGAKGHEKLFQDYRRAMDLCRDDSNFTNNSGMQQWRRAFLENGMVHGTMTLKSGVLSPNVAGDLTLNTGAGKTGANCTVGDVPRKKAKDEEGKLVTINDVNTTKYPLRKGSTQMLSAFVSPDSDALFGSVRIYHEGDNRDLLLNATALSNWSTSNQMMLWASGEWASIQDRRIRKDSNASKWASYNKTGVEDDAKTFLIKQAYYTFNKDLTNIEDNTILFTQPMKRPLVQLGDTADYWYENGTSNYPWGHFKINIKLYDDNEKKYKSAAGWAHVTSPHSTSGSSGYKNELQPISNIEEDTDVVKDEYFNNKTHGYADLTINNGSTDKVLPAIVTQMSASKVGNESQINWVYSTTVK